MNQQNVNNPMNGRNDSYEIDLRQIWAVFVARWKVFIIVAIGCGAITFAICNFIITPKYTAQSTILILNTNKEAGSLSQNDLTLSATLSKDFVAIATSTTSLDMVDDRVSTEGAKISASIVQDTRIIKIKVQHTDAEQAIKIADCVATVASERISEIMVIPDMVRIVDKASIVPKETTPHTMKYTAVACVLGFILAWLIFLIVFLSNDKINVVEDIDKYLGEPLLGTIPLYDARVKD